MRVLPLPGSPVSFRALRSLYDKRLGVLRQRPRIGQKNEPFPPQSAASVGLNARLGLGY